MERPKEDEEDVNDAEHSNNDVDNQVDGSHAPSCRAANRFNTAIFKICYLTNNNNNTRFTSV